MTSAKPFQIVRRLSRIRYSSAKAAYTLVELLVALVIASIVLGAAGLTLLVFLRSSQKYDAGQDARESANRLNYLVQIEASESKSIKMSFAGGVPAEAQSQMADCSIEYSSIKPLFMMKIPEVKGAYGVRGNESYILYYELGGDIRRCGPEVLANGQIKPGSESGTVDSELGTPIINPPPYLDGIVMRAAEITVASNATPNVDCGGQVSDYSPSTGDGRKLVFEIQFAGIKWKPECTVAKSKTVFVCSPLLGTEQEQEVIGTCKSSLLVEESEKIAYLNSSKDLNHFRYFRNRLA